jgi:hypothetical protein
MRTAILLAAACVACLVPAPGDDAPKPNVVLRSATVSPGVPMPEAKGPVYAVALDAVTNAKGEGKGTLTLTVTPPNYDEYGDFVTGRETDNVARPPRTKDQPAVALECKIELEKKGWVGRVNQSPTERSLFRLTGPKIRSTLYIATAGPGLASGRLLVHDKNDRVEYVVELTEHKPVPRDREPPPPPCHPGCFPAGTPVLTPDGTKRIELIKAGAVVTTIGTDGQPIPTKVQHVFTTTNMLVEVRTDQAMAVTTDSQPLCLTSGEFRKAGELKAGDRIWQWRDGRRAEAVVRAVAPTGRHEAVFNLIVGDSAMFVAGGFVVRGKPPAP